MSAHRRVVRAGALRQVRAQAKGVGGRGGRLDGCALCCMICAWPRDAHPAARHNSLYTVRRRVEQI